MKQSDLIYYTFDNRQEEDNLQEYCMALQGRTQEDNVGFKKEQPNNMIIVRIDI